MGKPKLDQICRTHTTKNHSKVILRNTEIFLKVFLEQIRPETQKEVEKYLFYLKIFKFDISQNYSPTVSLRLFILITNHFGI